MSIEPHSDPRFYFRERLVAATARHTTTLPPDVEAHLVSLLARGAPEDSTHPTLVHQLHAAAGAAGPHARRAAFEATGDRALYVVGFQGPHLARKGISPRYYASVGGRAYRQASGYGGAGRVTLRRLGEGFARWARLLDTVREETALRTPQDIVRLYDRYRRTGSSVLAERLREVGVYPQKPAPGTLH
ncbi:MAG: hypothetical protein AAF447_25450 [Myxococcota bacterium]